MRDNMSKGQAFVKLSKYKKALAAFRRSLKHAADNEEMVECHMAIADTCRMTGDFEESSRNYKEALSLMSRNAPERMDANVGLALSRRALGYHKDALKALDKALASYTKKEDQVGVAFATWARAGTLRIKGDIPSALKEFKASRKLFKALKDEPGVGYSLCGMGGTSRVKGDFDKSLEYYKEANELFRRLKDSFGTAYSHCGIGNALRMMGDYDDARDQFVSASSLYRRIGDIVSFSYTLWSLGKTHMLTGNLLLAEKYFKDAQRNFRITKDPRGLAYCRMGIGEGKLLMGNSAQRRVEARRYFTEARDICAEWEFGVELCHASALLSFLDDGQTDNSGYKALGLKLTYETVPFNIP